MIIYALLDPETERVRYIGKATSLKSRLSTHLRDARIRRTLVYNWIRSLMRKGLVPRIEQIEQADDWQSAEIRLIAKYRVTHPDLLNVADGGDEPFCPPEVRAANGRKLAGVRNERLWRIKQRMANALRHGYVSESTKAKLRLAAAKAPHLFGEYAKL